MKYLQDRGIPFRVEGIYAATSEDSFVTEEVNCIEVYLDGFEGDQRHAGFTKPAGVREGHHKKGDAIFNMRSWSAVSIRELETIAENLGVQKIDPSWLGANLALSIDARFSQVPPLSFLRFQGEKPVTLMVYEQNMPCKHPGEIIAREYGKDDTFASQFPNAAMGLRGLVGLVYKGGVLEKGMEGEIWVPRREEVSLDHLLDVVEA